MNEIDTERRLVETEQRSKSNSRRIDELAQRQDNLEKLATSVEVMATRMQTFESMLSEVRTDVRSIMEKPGKKWESVVDKVLMLLIAAVVAYALSKVGF